VPLSLPATGAVARALAVMCIMGRIGAALLTLGLLGGCAGGQPLPEPGTAAGPVELVIIKMGWHTEIAMPLNRVPRPLGGLNPRMAAAHYLVSGFGDRAYFTDPDPDPGTGKAIAALFSGPSAVQIAYFDVLPVQPGRAMVRLRVPQATIDRIADFVWTSLAKGPDGRPLLVLEQEPGNLFYDGRQGYDGLYNCNSWTADALRAGGLPFEPSGVLFAGEVMDQAARIAAAQASDVADGSNGRVTATDR